MFCLVKWFNPSQRYKSDERLSRHLGIGPVKLLFSKSSICKFLKDEKSLGIGHRGKD